MALSSTQSTPAAVEPPCRFCRAPLRHTFVDLGMSPLCQRHVRPAELNLMEPFYPLHVRVCEQCFLVQLEEYVSPREIFNDYAYFSSFSDTMLAHAEAYCQSMRDRLSLGEDSLVVELASNDGYLLQYFRQLGVAVLGIEPAANVAEAAIAKGIPTVTEFFGVELAQRLAPKGRADLIVGNNVLAHVPDINDFVGGMRVLLKPDGRRHDGVPAPDPADRRQPVRHHLPRALLLPVVPHRREDVRGARPHAVRRRGGRHARRLAAHLRPTSGERIVTGDASGWAPGSRTSASAGSTRSPPIRASARKVTATKRKLLSFLIDARNRGKSVVGYGAPGKGNTLLNYCGIRTDFLDYTVDRNPVKQGNYLPGTRIPICPPERIRETRPDYLLILPWNLKDEIMAQNAFIREWGGQFVVPLPETKVYP